MSAPINYLYHSVEPDAFSNTGYNEFDTLDFSLDFAGRAMVAGSVRLEGEIRVRRTATADILTNDRVCMDHMIGAHAVVQSCVSSTLNSGVIENITNLPRMVAMKTSATKNRNDMLNASMVCELRSPDQKIAEKQLQRRTPSDIGGGGQGFADANDHIGSAYAAAGEYTGDANASAFELSDFSFKPNIVFNNLAGPNKLVNYSTTGTVKLSFNLGRNAEVLYGPDVTTAFNYTLTNVRVCYTSVPEPPVQSPVSLRASICLKSNINSQLASTSNRVPAICDSCSISFISLARENSNFFPNTLLEIPPNLDAVRLNFNDSTNKYLAYELKTLPEIIGEGLKALANGSGSNDVTYDKLAANKGFVAGLKFGEQIDLSKQKFGIQVQSGVASTTPMVMYAFFHSLVSL